MSTMTQSVSDRAPRCPLAGGAPFEPGSLAATADLLARLGAKVSSEAFIDRLGTPRLVDGQPERWLPHTMLPRFTRLEIAWDVRDRTATERYAA